MVAVVAPGATAEVVVQVEPVAMRADLEGHASHSLTPQGCFNRIISACARRRLRLRFKSQREAPVQSVPR